MTMTHYLFHDANGELTGYAPGFMAWDGDPLASSPPPEIGTHARNVRDNMLGNMGCTDGVSEDCACDLGDYDCSHAQQYLNEKYVDVGGTDALTDKPALTILVDGVAHPEFDQTPIPKTPGSTVTLKLQATVPDGTQVTLKSEGAAVVQGDQVLTFTSNETNEIDMVAPSQGALGGLIGKSKLIRLVIVPILGWA